MRLQDRLSGYSIYFAGPPNHIPFIDQTPWYHKEVTFIDSTNSQNQTFVELTNQLDGITYGNSSLAMPKWVMLDCAILPSGIIGLAKNVEECREEFIKKFDLPKGYSGLVPVTQYCAIPTMEEGTWIGHTFSSPIRGQKLGLLTKLLALKMFGIKKLRGIAQFDNGPALYTHTRIADLRIVQATAVHTEPMTFVYEHDVDQETLEDLFENKRPSKQHFLLLNPHNQKEIEALQKRIETGEQLYITAPGSTHTSSRELRIPISSK